MSVFLKRKELLLVSGDYYKINLYVNNSLYKTIKVANGERSEALGTATGNDNTYEFYGWSTSPTSTTRSYTATASIKPTADMNLYAVFKHYIYTTKTPNINSFNRSSDSAIAYFRTYGYSTLKIYGHQYGDSASGGSGSINNYGGNTGISSLYINYIDKKSTPDSNITESNITKFIYNLSAGDIVGVAVAPAVSASNYNYSFTVYGQFSSPVDELTLNNTKYVLTW